MPERPHSRKLIRVPSRCFQHCQSTRTLWRVCTAKSTARMPPQLPHLRLLSFQPAFLSSRLLNSTAAAAKTTRCRDYASLDASKSQSRGSPKSLRTGCAESATTPSRLAQAGQVDRAARPTRLDLGLDVLDGADCWAEGLEGSQTTFQPVKHDLVTVRSIRGGKRLR